MNSLLRNLDVLAFVWKEILREWNDVGDLRCRIARAQENLRRKSTRDMDSLAKESICTVLEALINITEARLIIALKERLIVQEIRACQHFSEGYIGENEQLFFLMAEGTIKDILAELDLSMELFFFWQEAAKGDIFAKVLELKRRGNSRPQEPPAHSHIGKNVPCPADGSILSILKRLGIKVDLAHDKICGMQFRKWLKEHGLFYDVPPSRNWYEEKDAGLFASRIYRLCRVPQIRGILLNFAKSIGKEEETKQGLTGRHSKRKLYPFIIWMARLTCVTQVRQRMEGKLFAKIDITDMGLADLPLWPVDDKGDILEDLLGWMAARTRAPPWEYYSPDTRKVSLSQLLPKASPRPLAIASVSQRPKAGCYFS